MTILGSFNFIGSSFDKGDAHRETDVLMFADGRIWTGESVLIDTAPKIIVLSVKVTDKNQQLKTFDVAVGYAGLSAMVALSVITFASHVLSNLKGDSLPTIQQIAEFLSQALKASLEEFSSNQRSAGSAAFLVCGYESEIGTVQKVVKIVRVSDGYEASVSSPELPLAVISGPKDWNLSKLIANQMAAYPSSDGEHLIANQIELSLREQPGNSPYGGQLQLCTVGIDGVQLKATRVWDFSFRRPDLSNDWDHGDYRNMQLGYDVFDLRVGTCDYVASGSIQLPDTDGTKWAKSKVEGTERPPDDGDFFSRPRTGVLRI